MDAPKGQTEPRYVLVRVRIEFTSPFTSVLHNYLSFILSSTHNYLSLSVLLKLIPPFSPPGPLRRWIVLRFCELTRKTIEYVVSKGI